MNHHPILHKIHHRKEELNRYFFGNQKDVEFRFEQEFFVTKLLSLDKLADLKILLKTNLPHIAMQCNEPKYKSYTIAKKSGGTRLIQEPNVQLKKYQSILNFYLQQYYHFLKPEGVFGFVINPNKSIKKCNIADNASVHTNQKWVLNMDLKYFFPSIQAHKIKALFSSELFGYSTEIVHALSLLTTFEGKLPTGAPTSPVLSNFICISLDHDLLAYCAKNDIKYSRYADDLTFSSQSVFTEVSIESIKLIIAKHRFVLNDKKTRLKSINRKQTVTGLVVNQGVSINRPLLKTVRAMLFDASKNGIQTATANHFKLSLTQAKNQEIQFINKLNGYINFISQVKGKEDKMALLFRTQYNALVSNYFLKPIN
jgi:RNA-directed DNA polymerase